ncbi:MAG: signal peptidase II [Gemmatimonadales bacterium]|nr:MAG: signal peptidase II [Gemmatimonadales bacterium]
MELHEETAIELPVTGSGLGEFQRGQVRGIHARRLPPAGPAIKRGWGGAGGGPGGQDAPHSFDGPGEGHSLSPRPRPLPGGFVKARWTTAGILVATILVLDLWTKSWALATLGDGRSDSLLGGLIPLNLAFNTGAAFGIGIGDDSRWLFVPLTIVAVGFLGWLIQKAERGDHLRVVSAALVLGGALGNLWDRVRWDQGVVDFIGPVDLGFMLWPIFNVADMAITTGAILLAISLWREDAGQDAEEGGGKARDGGTRGSGTPENRRSPSGDGSGEDEVAPGSAAR